MIDSNSVVYSRELHLFCVIGYISAFIFASVSSILLFSLVRNTENNSYSKAISSKLQFLWISFMSAVILFFIYISWKELIEIRDTKYPDLVIKVIGHQWYWEYKYIYGTGSGIGFNSVPNTPFEEILGNKKSEHYLRKVTKPLVIPVHTKIRFVITSADVIHGYFVPSLGIKLDAIPGFIKDTWTEANNTGRYYGACTVLCGMNHFNMPIVVDVVSRADYIKWTNKLIYKSVDNSAHTTYKLRCAYCHGNQGEGRSGIAPRLVESSCLQINSNADLEIINNGKNAMPGFKNELTKEEILSLSKYIRSMWGVERT